MGREEGGGFRMGDTTKLERQALPRRMGASGALWLIWAAWQPNIIKMDAVCPRTRLLHPWDFPGKNTGVKNLPANAGDMLWRQLS